MNDTKNYHSDDNLNVTTNHEVESHGPENDGQSFDCACCIFGGTKNDGNQCLACGEFICADCHVCSGVFNRDQHSLQHQEIPSDAIINVSTPTYSRCRRCECMLCVCSVCTLICDQMERDVYLSEHM